ncbi:hypothetical protein HRR83_004499 [Exophiala dermatitidis]|nr:hypothetical protein HRR74_004221 [Exophiala dermatitidis]KAJ4529293.1 hypothetical protein HRR73_000316 [Exophiala dermatitidis]KAJ4544053.1 hypothetical protein HRR76_002126 [Exophiala dermatitidis]KAJ4575518.1 hypothetical protein HRR79_002436 [Exophiala dermatitidis]KAJ4582670.1 hypothetical protein HRR81_001399 [Exophiala dermatitidis]
MSEHNLSDQDQSNALRVPACDSCRARKIRCDRKNPCSSCRASGISCRTTKRTPEKRQRILVSGRYEREIEHVNGRLANLEGILQTLANHQKQNSPCPAQPAIPEGLSTPQDSQRVGSELAFTGDSSFDATSKHFTQALEHSLDSSSHAAFVRDVSDAVATLRNTLNEKPAATDGTVPVDQLLEVFVHYPELSRLALPPQAPVLTMLRYTKTHPQRLFCDVPILDGPYIIELCQKVYFPTEEYTIATFLTVHTSLYYLFRDLTPEAARDLRFTPQGIDQITAMCKKNAEVAMRNVRLFMDVSYENAEALFLAAMLAMEQSRNAFAWTLITNAARMVQDAGYHRLPPYSVAPEAAKKRLLFWIVYALDRGMALNLGRSPSLQDCDITVDRPKFPEEVTGTWGALYVNWIDFAELQGQIYEKLYCPRAQKQPIEMRVQQARDLAGRLLALRDTVLVNSEKTPFPEALSELMLSVDIVLDATLTLIYRVIPPAPLTPSRTPHPLKFCDEALQSARMALIKHNRTWEIMKHRAGEKWRLFIYWTLVWVPFIPFLVVFGNVIADHDVDDLRLLEQVVCTLQGAAQASDGVSKLYRACTVFSHVATVYLGKGQGHADPTNHTSYQTGESAQPGHNVGPTPTYALQPETSFGATGLQDIPFSQQDWNDMFDDWDFGLGAENAREMSTFLESSLAGADQPGDMQMGNA